MTNAEAVARLRTMRAIIAAGKISKAQLARWLFSLGVVVVDDTLNREAVATSVEHQQGNAGSTAARRTVIAQLNSASGAIADAVAIIQIGTQYGAHLSGKPSPTQAQIQAAVNASAS